MVKGGRDLIITKDQKPIVKYMLKVREEHAKKQEKDYSHVFRSKTRLDFIRLSAILVGIEFAYAAETAFVSPILLQIGIEHQHMTMVWALSPLLGFFLAPLLGSLSDRCRLSIGRRRPVIIMLSVGILIGLLLVPYGREIGTFFGDGGNAISTMDVSKLLNNTNSSSPFSDVNIMNEPALGNYKYAAILTILGTILLDFDADTCQTPARAYLLDVCIQEDHSRALSTFSIMAGLGGTVGYALGAIDWETLTIGAFLGGNIQTVFFIVTIVFIFCFIITIISFREIPLKLIEKDELLRPLSSAAIKKEMEKNTSTLFYIQETTSLELKICQLDSNNTKQERYQNFSECNESSKSANVNSNHQSHFVNRGFIPDGKNVEILTNIANGRGSTTSVESSDSEDDQRVSLGTYLKSIVIMPKSIAILSITNLLCWMGHICYCLYFTDFVGEAVFNGDPTANIGSKAHDLYQEGVRFGCWGMSIYALSCSVYSFSVEKLMRYLGVKLVYVGSILIFAIGMLILGLWPTKIGVLLLSTTAGVIYATIFTMPYILVAKYHSSGCFKVRKNGENVPLKQSRGLGTDLAIISSMVFIAQLIVSLSLGSLISLLGTTSTVLYAASACSVGAAIMAFFILYV